MVKGKIKRKLSRAGTIEEDGLLFCGGLLGFADNRKKKGRWGVKYHIVLQTPAFCGLSLGGFNIKKEAISALKWAEKQEWILNTLKSESSDVHDYMKISIAISDFLKSEK